MKPSDREPNYNYCLISLVSVIYLNYGRRFLNSYYIVWHMVIYLNYVICEFYDICYVQISCQYVRQGIDSGYWCPRCFLILSTKACSYQSVSTNCRHIILIINIICPPSDMCVYVRVGVRVCVRAMVTKYNQHCGSSLFRSGY